MKVILTLPSLSDPGGVAGYYRTLLPALAAHGTLVSPFEVGGTHNVLGILHPVRDQLALAVRLRKERFDLIHVNPSLGFKSFVRDGLFVLQALRNGLHVVVFFHGWWRPFEHTIERYLSRFFRMSYGRADSIVVLSSAFADKLRQWGVTAPIHVTTTALPDDFAHGFSIERRVQGIKLDRQTRILFLARLEKAKGVFQTIEAVKILGERGLDVRLDIAGDGRAADEVKKHVARTGPFSERIRLLGYVRGESKREVLALNQIYCLPSISEGMPVSILEAMAFGMPVLARAVGGLRDFLMEGKTGYAITTSDPQEVANLLQRLISDREAMASIARFNCQYVSENCLASRASQVMGEIYREASEN